MIAQGDVWWADLDEPVGSEPGYRRPVVVIQGDTFNRSRLATVVCVAVTSQLARNSAPGSVLVTSAESGLPRDSVVNVTQIYTLDRSRLTEQAGRLSPARLRQVFTGIDLVLGR